ncbi:MAG: L-aspartate oxidase [bacterium]|nr:L-aspartate oxidase [bacterium]
MKHESDLLIIGTGIAGMSAAIYAADVGLTVDLVTKGSDMTDSNTYCAQGGIIFRGENDSPETLINDIIYAGAGLSLPENAKILAEEGPYYIQDLLIKKARINFTRNKAGQLDLTEEAAHSVKRIIHSTDATGKAIVKGLYRLIRNNKKIRIFRNHICLDLIKNRTRVSGREKAEILGAYILDLKGMKTHVFLAKATVLATGGLGQIYTYTTNPLSATGDGFALAFRAGARIINMEYTQFHPTALYQQKPYMFLITEMVRGEGGHLKNRDGKEFMKKYHSQASLAPRDVVARAIHDEMLQNHQPYVLLDIHSYMDREKIRAKFPTIYRTCLENGIDITRQPIPVVPAFHFICGGIKVDEWARTSMRGLFAVGEVSCTGIHGANRLASTSLLEGLVWAGRCIKYICANKDQFRFPVRCRIKVPKREKSSAGPADPAWIKKDWTNLKNIMWNYVGLVRSSSRLNRAYRDLKNLKHAIDDFYKDYSLDRDVIELYNGIQTAIIIVKHALKNKQSRGTHYLID